MKCANFFGLKWAYWQQELIPGAAKVAEIDGARLFFPDERSVELTAALREFWHGWAGGLRRMTGPGDVGTRAGKGVLMAIGFHDGSRSLQDRFDTRGLADRIDGLLVSDTISENDRGFIQQRDMFFLATADAEGRPTCSYKGGEPGFVRVLDPRTLVFPNYDGNGMYLSAGNVLMNPNVGMLFIDFERGHRMRLEGTASIDPADPLIGDYPEAQFVVRVRARAVYPNCPRYIHRYKLVKPSRFVPHSECVTPVPEWKRSDWAADVLPEHDPARDPAGREVLGR